MSQTDFMQKWVEKAQKEHTEAAFVAMDSSGDVYAYFLLRETKRRFSCEIEIIGHDDENAHLWKTSLRQFTKP